MVIIQSETIGKSHVRGLVWSIFPPSRIERMYASRRFLFTSFGVQTLDHAEKKKDEPVTKEQKTRSINAGYSYWPVNVICQYYTWTPAPRRVFYDSRAAVIDMQIQR